MQVAYRVDGAVYTHSRNQEMMMNFIDLSLKEETPYAAEFTQLSVAMAPHVRDLHSRAAIVHLF